MKRKELSKRVAALLLAILTVFFVGCSAKEKDTVSSVSGAEAETEIHTETVTDESSVSKPNVKPCVFKEYKEADVPAESEIGTYYMPIPVHRDYEDTLVPNYIKFDISKIESLVNPDDPYHGYTLSIADLTENNRYKLISYFYSGVYKLDDVEISNKASYIKAAHYDLSEFEGKLTAAELEEDSHFKTPFYFHSAFDIRTKLGLMHDSLQNTPGDQVEITTYNINGRNNYLSDVENVGPEFEFAGVTCILKSEVGNPVFLVPINEENGEYLRIEVNQGTAELQGADEMSKEDKTAAYMALFERLYHQYLETMFLSE